MIIPHSGSANCYSQRRAKGPFAKVRSDGCTVRYAKIFASRPADSSHHAENRSLLLGKRESIAARDAQFLLRDGSFKPKHHRPVAPSFDDAEIIAQEIHHNREIEGRRVIEILMND